MAYYNGGYARIPYFSNPNVTFQGAKLGAEDGADVTSDADPDYISNGGNAGYDGSNPDLGARNADFIRERARFVEDNATRPELIISDLSSVQVTEGGSSNSPVKAQ